MNISNVGYNYRHPADFYINRPVGSGDYLFLVIRTDAFLELDGIRQEVKPNSFLVFNKGTPQYYGAYNGEYINDWIHFDADENDLVRFEKLGIPFDTIIPLNDVTVFSELIKNMINERYSLNEYREESVKLYFELILVKLAERLKQSGKNDEKRYYDELAKMRNAIYVTPDKDWSVEAVSKKVGLSNSYVQHLYKSCFGTSIISDIITSRMEYAKYLLSSTDMSVNCIAASCGYKTDVHFMRMFKKLTGETPSAFRKRTHIDKVAVMHSWSEAPFAFNAQIE